MYGSVCKLAVCVLLSYLIRFTVDSFPASVSVQEVMLRRLKRDVMAELPPKRRQVVRLPRPKPADWPNQEVAEGERFMLLTIPLTTPVHCSPRPHPHPQELATTLHPECLWQPTCVFLIVIIPLIGDSFG